MFKKIYYDDCNFELITPSEYIDKYPNIQVSSPCRSSWGANGYSGVWLNPTNDYAHRHLHKAGDRMVELATSFPDADGIVKDALNQAARELLLAQTSCWLFIITNGTMVDYAKNRIKTYIGRFTKLYSQIKKNDPSLDTMILTAGAKSSAFDFTIAKGFDALGKIVTNITWAIREQERIRKQVEAKQFIKMAIIVFFSFFFILFAIDLISGIMSPTKQGLLGIVPIPQ
mgnify:CR=1 FL=1